MACALGIASATTDDFTGVVRVGLHAGSDRRSVTLDLPGTIEIVDLGTSRPVGRAAAGPLDLVLDGGEIRCGAARSRVGFRFASPAGDGIGLGKRRYSGSLEVWHRGGALTTVDEVDVEAYVAGALRIEGSPSLAPEALKALAVAIRTYALRSGRRHDLYDVCDTTHCQGFAGIPDAASGWAWRAAAGTAGQILMWRGAPIWALYSTDCGGSTASNDDGGAGSSPLPYLRAIEDSAPSGRAACAASPFHHWQVDVPLPKIDRATARRLHQTPGRLAAVRVDRTDAFGRAVTVRLEYRVSARTDPSIEPGFDLRPRASRGGAKGGETALLRAVDLRALLGEDLLKSTRFRVSVNGDVARFTGSGYGHGVGMCMFGAGGLARAGWRYSEILAHYYAGASLQPWYNEAPTPSSERSKGPEDLPAQREP